MTSVEIQTSLSVKDAAQVFKSGLQSVYDSWNFVTRMKYSLQFDALTVTEKKDPFSALDADNSQEPAFAVAGLIVLNARRVTSNQISFVAYEGENTRTVIVDDGGGFVRKSRFIVPLVAAFRKADRQVRVAERRD